MDLNIILWIGGMLFSLGIFAVKVGFGLGFSRLKWKGIFLTLSIYLLLFVFIAVLSGQLIELLEPILRKGPHLHLIMAGGMIIWGVYIVRESNSFTIKVEKTTSLSQYRSALLLLIPCPICLTAIAFSTWSALTVIKMPSVLVGLGLGIVFILLTLTIYFSLRLLTRSSFFITQRIGLGLSMIIIGVYFITSLYIPSKIEEAKEIYSLFLPENGNVVANNAIGVFAVLFISMIVGYLIKKKENKK